MNLATRLVATGIIGYGWGVIFGVIAGPTANWGALEWTFLMGISFILGLAWGSLADWLNERKHT